MKSEQKRIYTEGSALLVPRAAVVRRELEKFLGTTFAWRVLTVLLVPLLSWKPDSGSINRFPISNFARGAATGQTIGVFPLILIFARAALE
jgi:hypothetical protein